MRKIFLLVFYNLVLTPALFSRAPLPEDTSFTVIMPATETVAHSEDKEVAEASSQKKNSRFFTTPQFVVKLLNPKTRRSATHQPEARSLEDFKLPKYKADPNENRTHFMRKDTESSQKKVTKRRSNLVMSIRRTQLSDAALYETFAEANARKMVVQTNLETKTKYSEYLYCEDCVIQIIQENGMEPEIFDISDEFVFEPDTDQDLYNLVVFKTTDTDEELLLGCLPPAPTTESIWVPNKKRWGRKQTYTRKDGDVIHLKALHFPGKIFLRDGQFLTIAVDDAGYCYIKPMSSSEIFAMGYEILYR